MQQKKLDFTEKAERHTLFEVKEHASQVVTHHELLSTLKEHVGRASAINSKDIAQKLGRVVNNTNRRRIRKTAKELLAMGYLVVTCREGFYMATNEEEVAEFRRGIEIRALGLQRTLKDLDSAWEKRGSQ